MSKRALAYDMHSIKVDGQDVEDVYDKAREAIEHARGGGGPVFLDVETVRLHGHYIGDPQVYRSKDEIKDVAEHRDPINALRGLLEIGEDEWQRLDAEVLKVVEESVDFAKAGTDPKPEDAMKNVYA
jgi:TPP-dependent pyruvate/acetoin dehydrogenase alpha subunit